MPLPTARPSQRTSTASPASNSPSTSTTPTGSKLVPRSRRACSAPSSTTSRPWVGFAYLSHSLKLETRPSCGWKRVPLGAPASAVATASRSTPLVIVTGIPAAVAISAATTFERMPPDPSGEVERPMS
jgi:hypothetical protein